jgi:hypothetical protein
MCADPRILGIAIEFGPLAAGYGKLMEVRRCVYVCVFVCVCVCVCVCECVTISQTIEGR